MFGKDFSTEQKKKKKNREMQKYRAQGEGEREDKRETDLYRKVKGETQNYKKRKDTTFHAQTSISSFIVNFQRDTRLSVLNK